MLREATWRWWILPAVLITAAIVLGLFYAVPGRWLEWIFKIGTLACTFAPPGAVAAYTASGRKWWLNDLGTSFVQVLMYIVILVAPLAWSAWLDNGSITGGLVAWLEIVAPILVTAGIVQVGWVVHRIATDPEPAPPSPEPSAPA